MRHCLWFLPLLTASALSAQQASFAGAPDTSAFRRLELPAPNTVRTGSGAPGSDYWQQRVDYVIRATLDTSTRTVRGEERITYTNNSPDTLRYLWLHLDQNAVQQPEPGRPDLRSAGAGSGRAARRVAYGSSRWRSPPPRPRAAVPASPAAQLAYLVNGTRHAGGPRPARCRPKARQVLDIAWSFPFGPNRNRMGIEEIDGGVTYEVAQWYPRLAVYDDVRGWNTEQYYGQGEFYLEYGSFDVSLTVPADMILAATGVLRNPAEVLTADPALPPRAGAHQRDHRGDPRTATRWAIPPRGPASAYGTLTWRFTADSVRDFAWAGLADVRVGRGRGERRQDPGDELLPAVDRRRCGRKPPSTPRSRSRTTRRSGRPIPTPSRATCAAIEGGMEYPMIVFCNRPTPETLYSVTDHEFGHTWFPMVVGSNERRYAWMDEGFNEFINYYNWQKKFGLPPAHRGSIRGLPGDGHVGPGASDHDRRPTRSRACSSVPRRTTSRRIALRLLRDVVARRRSASIPAFKEYFRRWAYKHPTPADFFRTIEDGVGEDLSWFWRSWLFTTAQLDQAVDSVVAGRLGRGGVADLPAERGRHPDAGGSGAADGRRLDAAAHAAGRDLVRRGPLHRDRAGTEEGQRRSPSIPSRRYPDVRRENNRWPARSQLSRQRVVSTSSCHRPLIMSLA